MKSIVHIVILLLTLVLISCNEKSLHPLVMDNIPPGKVDVLNVTPLPGGLRVEYNLPADNDILYVKAEYQLAGGKTGEVSASYFDNRLDILGFGDTLERTVKLYAVDRSENSSEIVEFSGRPLEAPVFLISHSMSISADFGGARFSWKNETEAAVAIMIYAEDSLTGEMKNVQTLYTSAKEGKFSLRGYDAVPTRFTAIIRDRWDNLTDTIKPAGSEILIPWAETRLDKTKFRKLELQNDTPWDAWEGKYEYGYDDNFNSTFVHSQGDHAWPQIFSIDLGVRVKLSRFRVYMRGPESTWFYYSHGNPKRYDVYGAVNLPNMTGDLSGWTKLRDECISIQPSGKSELTDEDIAHAQNGDEYDFDQANNPTEIRYFRLVIWETWDGAGFINFNEISFWGSILETYNAGV